MPSVSVLLVRDESLDHTPLSFGSASRCSSDRRAELGSEYSSTNWCRGAEEEEEGEEVHSPKKSQNSFKLELHTHRERERERERERGKQADARLTSDAEDRADKPSKDRAPEKKTQTMLTG